MVQLVGGAIVWRSGLAVDGDGSPHCYHPDDASGLDGLDSLADAGLPGAGYGVVKNAHGVPIIQGPNDPAPGFYVSQTSLVDRSKAVTDPTRYVNAETVPYVTCTHDMHRSGVMMGDVAMVIYNHIQCAAIVADSGPHPGEGSIALAKALGIPSSPRNGGISSPAVSFIIFCGSTLGWPRTTDVESQAQSLFDNWGGLERLAQVLK